MSNRLRERSNPPAPAVANRPGSTARASALASREMDAEIARLSRGGASESNTAVRVSVIVPTLNEASNLPHVLPRIPVWVHEVVVVDGHSEDDTVLVARRLAPEARVILQVGRGKGNALACGFAAATGDIIVMLDADGSTDPAEIPRFVQALLEGADFAKGSRCIHDGGSEDLSPLRAAGNSFLTRLVNLVYRARYTDLCYGYNAFWSRCLDELQVDCDGFEVETLIHTRALRSGLSVQEVPSVEHLRLHGESNLRAFRDGWRVLRTIVRERIRRMPSQPEAQAPAFRELDVRAGLT